MNQNSFSTHTLNDHTTLIWAAETDDINTVVHFINNMSRTWITLMVVGFGYGANMLIEYLAEVGAYTVLTNATSSDVVDVVRLFFGFSDGIIQVIEGRVLLNTRG